MEKRDITLAWPDHPALAEMVSALGSEVTYHIVGAKFRERREVPVSARGGIKLAYKAALRIRRHAAGAIAYHRARSAWLLRSTPANRLVHCCSLVAYGKRPWVGDYENANVLAFYSPRLLASRHLVGHLRKTMKSAACRAIRVWSPSAALSFRTLFDDPAITAKLRVIYPAIAFPPEAIDHQRKEGPPRILFIGKGFWIKGGGLLLGALVKLRSQVDFRADFVCDLPPECQFYRSALEGFVTFHEPGFTRHELYSQFYRRADIFVMLGMADSYGLALLEASAFGLPIVAMALHSGLSDLLRLTGNAVQLQPEYQIFNENGLHSTEPDELVDQIRRDGQEGLVDRIAATLAGLISDRARREEIGERGRLAVRYGALSIGAMRDGLLGLYSSVMD